MESKLFLVSTLYFFIIMKKLILLLVASLILTSCSNLKKEKTINVNVYKEQTLENKYCIAKFNYPKYSVNNTPLLGLNNTIANYIDTVIDKNIHIAKKDSSIIKKYKEKYKLVINTNDFITSFGTISVLVKSSFYSPSDSLKSVNIKTFNYDLENNKYMNISDVISFEQNKINQLKNILYNKNNNCSFNNLNLNKNYNLFLIDEDSIHFLFKQNIIKYCNLPVAINNLP